MRAHQRLTIDKGAGHGDVAQAKTHEQSPAGIGQHGLGRVGQQRQVGSRIADVIEGAKAFFEPNQLAAAGQVGGRIGGQHPGEHAEMRCYALGEGAVGTGGQVKQAPFAPLGFKKAQQCGVIGQARGVDFGTRGDFRLEVGLAAAQPQRQAPEFQRMAAEELTHAIHQGVGFDQGAIEIDAQRPLQPGDGRGGGV